MPATARASRAAWTLRVVVVSLSAAMRRSRMPVRLTIHSSDVSTSFSRSWFVITRDGAYMPQPVISALAIEVLLERMYLWSCRIDLEQRLLPLHQRPILDEDAGDPAR